MHRFLADHRRADELFADLFVRVGAGRGPHGAGVARSVGSRAIAAADEGFAIGGLRVVIARAGGSWPLRRAIRRDDAWRRRTRYGRRVQPPCARFGGRMASTVARRGVDVERDRWRFAGPRRRSDNWSVSGRRPRCASRGPRQADFTVDASQRRFKAPPTSSSQTHLGQRRRRTCVAGEEPGLEVLCARVRIRPVLAALEDQLNVAQAVSNHVDASTPACWSRSGPAFVLQHLPPPASTPPRPRPAEAPHTPLGGRRSPSTGLEGPAAVEHGAQNSNSWHNAGDQRGRPTKPRRDPPTAPAAPEGLIDRLDRCPLRSLPTRDIAHPTDRYGRGRAWSRSDGALLATAGPRHRRW